MNIVYHNAPVDVNMTISPNDEMFGGNIDVYMSVSFSAMNCINTALQLSEITPQKILDLPCGHGRVARSLRAYFPDAEITVCDLNKDGVDFCAENFNAIGIYSDSDVSKIPIHSNFDLIWSGSLLTHLSREKAEEFMNFFIDRLKPNGVLVVSLHGRYSEHVQKFYKYIEDDRFSKILAGFNSIGYGYSNYAWVDNTGDEYGISMQKISYTMSHIESRKDIKVIYYSEQLWDKHQDVLAIQKNHGDKSMIKGHIDKASQDIITGWAWLPNYPSINLTVYLLDSDSNVIASTRAEAFRQDLLYAGIGNGKYAYTFTDFDAKAEKLRFSALNLQLDVRINYHEAGVINL